MWLEGVPHQIQRNRGLKQHMVNNKLQLYFLEKEIFKLIVNSKSF